MDDAPLRALALGIMEHPDPFVVVLVGELDIANVDFVVALASHSSNGHGTVVFDLADLTFVDSSGVQAFIAIARAADKFRCLNACPQVEHEFRLAGLHDWLDSQHG
jgi:anti-anti-sigma factor